MKKIIFYLFICSLVIACNMATPENYFDAAVLNANMIAGFAGQNLQYELDNPSAKLVEGTKDQTAPMKRKEIIEGKIQFIESSQKKVKQLKQTKDTKTMLQASLALYGFVLPVYKNEYMQLASLYDDGAPKEKLQSFAESIYSKYGSKFSELYNNLISEGKSYAQKNNIKVNWDIHTSPQ